ncbi:MAG: hypothetical protein WBP34_06450 [Thermoanaerobaculia bacterium]
MRWPLRTILAATLLGSILAACGGSAPKGETEQAPAAEASDSSESDPVIFEEGFEAGDDQDWSDSEVAPEGEDSEPEVPEQD